MLDGRVLGASQVEYKPFGKPSKERGSSLVRSDEPGTSRDPREFGRQRHQNPLRQRGRSLFTPSKERGSGNVGITYIELPPKFDSESFNTSGTSSTQVPLVLLVFTFLPRQAAEPPLSPGSLLYALNFNMSEYMSDEHVHGTRGLRGNPRD